jgi:hypothetical protein
MPVRRLAPLLAVLVLVVTFVASCDSPTEAPAPGAIMITVLATGIDIRHPDSGYRAAVDGGTPLRMDSLRKIITDIEPGSHAVRLDGIVANCAVAGQNPMSVSVASNETALATFNLSCVSHVGTVRVTWRAAGPRRLERHGRHLRRTSWPPLDLAR